MQSTTNFNHNDKTDESNAADQQGSTNVSSSTTPVEKKGFNENLCKVFIGNISRTATEEQLREFFEQKSVQFKDISLMKDPVNPSMNRGFGFFTLKTEEETDSLLFTEMEAFQGKTLDIKRAAPKDVDDPLIQTKTERIFVGGLPQVYTVEEITDMFNEKYGNIGKVVEVIPKKDKVTGKSRGFCFIVFENFHVVDKIMIDDRFPYLNNKRLEVRKASSDFPIQGGPPPDGSGMPRRSGGPGGRIPRGGGGHDRNSRMNQNPYRNGSHQGPNMRHAPRKQSPYVNNSHSMHNNHYGRQSYGYTNRPPPGGYAGNSPAMGSNPYMSSYGSHMQDAPPYGGNQPYAPYGASSQQPPMPSSYSGPNQYPANPYGAATSYTPNQGQYQQNTMPTYPGSGSGTNIPSSNPPANQNHPGGY